MTGWTRGTGKFAACVLGFLALGMVATACGPNHSQAAPSGAATAPRPAAASGSSQPAAGVSALIHPAGKFFGLEINGAPDSLSPVLNVAASVGRNPNLLGQYVAWNAPFDTAAAASALSYGALYYAAWEPFRTSATAIASGRSDQYITKFAQAVRAFGHPVALSFGHEMNGNWYPWGTNETTAAAFVAAWRHVHDLFAAAGADNVIWVWNPNIINPMPAVQLKPYWPGAAYVDWVGITGYFSVTGAHTFAGVYGPTMTEVRQFAGKPFIIAETSVESSSSEIDSVHSLITGVEEHNDVLGLIWFNYDKDGVDWTLTGRPMVRAAAAGSLAGMKLVSLAT